MGAPWINDGDGNCQNWTSSSPTDHALGATVNYYATEETLEPQQPCNTSGLHVLCACLGTRKMTRGGSTVTKQEDVRIPKTVASDVFT